MKKITASLFANAVALYLISVLFDGVTLELKSLVIMTIVFTVLNIIVKPILTVLTLPLTILTLGLFSFVLNGIMLLITFKMVPGAACDGLWTCILASIVISVVNSVLGNKLKK